MITMMGISYKTNQTLASRLSVGIALPILLQDTVGCLVSVYSVVILSVFLTLVSLFVDAVDFP